MARILFFIVLLSNALNVFGKINPAECSFLGYQHYDESMQAAFKKCLQTSCKAAVDMDAKEFGTYADSYPLPKVLKELDIDGCTKGVTITFTNISLGSTRFYGNAVSGRHHHSFITQLCELNNKHVKVGVSWQDKDLCSHNHSLFYNKTFQTDHTVIVHISNK